MMRRQIFLRIGLGVFFASLVLCGNVLAKETGFGQGGQREHCVPLRLTSNSECQQINNTLCIVFLKRKKLLDSVVATGCLVPHNYFMETARLSQALRTPDNHNDPVGSSINQD